MSKHLIHAHSSTVTEGAPNLPAANRIEYGEIAINYAKGHETISIKNSNNEIVTFPNTNSVQDNLDKTEKVIASALNDLNDRVDDLGDEIESTATSIQTQINNVSNNLSSLSSDVDDIDTAVSALSSDVSDLGESVSDLSTDWDNTEFVLSNAINDINGKLITRASATIDDEVGLPEVNVEISNGNINLDFKNLKGEKGIPGDTVILGNEQNYTLYSDKGQNTDGAMTQKAVTDEFTNVDKSLSIQLTGVPNIPYAILATGKFGTSTSSRHTIISVQEGEQFIIENYNATTDNVRYAFATSTTSVSGGDVPLVSGTSVVQIPHSSYVLVTIPAGTTHLLVNYYGYSCRIFKYQDRVKDEYYEKTYPINNTNRYIKISDGSLGTGDAYKTSDYIPLQGEYKLSCPTVYVGGSGTSVASFAFYTSSKEFITNMSSINTTANVPYTAKYFRMTTTSSETSFTVKHYGISQQSVVDRLPETGEIDKIENYLFAPIDTVHDVNNGYIVYSDGSVSSGASYRRTGFIPLCGETKVSSSDAYVGGSSSTVATIAFYDSSKTWISSVRTANSATVPSNAAFVRFTCKASVQSEKLTVTHYNIPFQYIYDRLALDSFTALKGRKVAFIGDSITKGTYGITGPDYAYHSIFAQMTGCTNINLGENSAVYVTNPNGGNNTHPRLMNKVTSENLSSVDMVVVFAGTNDFAYDSKPIGSPFAEETITSQGRIGTKKRVPPSDTDTFSGAVHELILAIRAIIAEKRIILMTPLNRGHTASDTYNPNTAESNVNGDYMSDYVDTLKEIGRFYSIPVFETGAVFNCDPTDKTGRGQSSYFYDTLHLTDAGQARLGKQLYNFVKSIWG